MYINESLADDSADRRLEVNYTRIEKLIPDPRNARTHSKKQVTQIAESIRAFGFTNPILADPMGNIIAGHGRLRAARELNLAEVPVIVLAGLSEPQKKALRLADNKIALNAGWDMEILKLELTDLSLPEVDIDLGLTGFSPGEIDVALADSEDPDDEVIPAVPENPRVNSGDIWQLGEHRVACGDGRDAGFLQNVVGDGALIDCAFLDPPYNVKINGHANAKGRHREFAMASGEMKEAEFRMFLAETLGACAKVSRSGAVHFICMDWRHMDDVTASVDDIYGDLLNICVWNKSNAGMGSLYRSKHEMVFVYRVGDEPHINNVELGKHGRNRTNVWDYPSVNSMRGSRREDLALHPTVKPVAMVADAYCDVTRQNELVLDIFLGSGTSLVAAERVGRAFRGLDIDPAYVDLAMQRWSDLTGKEPQLVFRDGEELAA
ncbi:site-specific DNA-methyltransferase [Sphingorhabdus sp. SMR4y]|uniref:site-specific DNA-methyltransferase n=1 Tax=Sphingorhabdus sp. SMR4y TaxID=2584094 RepID=UPI000B5D05D7|nr:DNA methyltransferase [Sphingorhabdus sp. SMR4y]ASK89100.1 modification methylase DpnIIB [Sphingorhabdus sp. SMR4y]